MSGRSASRPGTARCSLSCLDVALRRIRTVHGVAVCLACCPEPLDQKVRQP